MMVIAKSITALNIQDKNIIGGFAVIHRKIPIIPLDNQQGHQRLR